MSKSIEERVEEVLHDEKKFKRFFSFAWIVAYGMLVLGFIIILWVLLQGQ
jgi:predicted nucleic acid-binding Zn ribbon protein